MIKRMSLFAVAAAIAFAVAAPSPTAFADNATTTKKATHKKRHVAKRASQYPELEPFRSSGFIGPFPGSCAYDRAAGNCMMDLGYGRCVPCDVGGGGGRP